MHNYAYLIGRLVKVGVDSSDESLAKRREDHQITAEVGAAIYGIDPPAEVITLWQRATTERQDAYAIEAMLKAKFKASAVFGREWLVATPDILKFFESLQTNREWADQWCDSVVKIRFGSVS